MLLVHACYITSVTPRGQLRCAGRPIPRRVRLSGQQANDYWTHPRAVASLRSVPIRGGTSPFCRRTLLRKIACQRIASFFRASAHAGKSHPRRRLSSNGDRSTIDVLYPHILHSRFKTSANWRSTDGPTQPRATRSGTNADRTAAGPGGSRHRKDKRRHAPDRGTDPTGRTASGDLGCHLYEQGGQ